MRWEGFIFFLCLSHEDKEGSEISHNFFHTASCARICPTICFLATLQWSHYICYRMGIKFNYHNLNFSQVSQNPNSVHNVNVNLSLHLSTIRWRHEGVEIQFHVFLTSVLDRSVWSASSFGRLSSREKTSGVYSAWYELALSRSGRGIENILPLQGTEPQSCSQ
jgi:hypothetical protein